jgi:hypothetical protein
MATSRTSVASIKSEAREAYADGRELGLSHGEAVLEAAQTTGNATSAVAEWCHAERRRFEREEAEG